MRFWIAYILPLLLVTSHAFALEESVLKNMYMSRTISGTVNIFKTSKLEANGVQMLEEPSIEFMIEIECDGKTTTLLPGDFYVIKDGEVEENKVTKTTVQLVHRENNFPMKIFVYFYREAKSPYMQKSIAIGHCNKPAGITIKRITLEYIRLKNNYLPVVPYDRFVQTSEADAATAINVKSSFSLDGFSSFAAVDPKTNKGIFFVAEPQRAKVVYTPRHFLTITEEANAPLANGYETARITIGAASGAPEAIYKQYREYLLNSRCTALKINKNLEAFKKRFDAYFQACQYISIPKENTGIDAEGHIVDSKGFLILFNSSDKPQKMLIPFDEPNLALNGELKLTDWTSLDLPTDIGVFGVNDKKEIEIEPGLMKVIGINI